MNCPEPHMLRALLDQQLPPDQQQAYSEHIHHCATCQAILHDQRALAQQVQILLHTTEQPHPQAALQRFRSQQPAHETITNRTSIPIQRRRLMNPTRPSRRWIAPLMATILAIATLALPPVRAAADQFLQIFRVQSVVFVPVSRERMDQLEQLNFDGKSLFLAEPTVRNQDAEPRPVASAEEASTAIGLPLEQPATVAGSPATYTVTEANQAEFQVNVASAREFLQLAGVSNITLPDALGSGPIQVAMAPAAVAVYEQGGVTTTLIQGRAPEVTLPEGVELRDLGRAALRILGMSPEQADALANQIDWSSTLIVPFPSDLSSIRQVSINGAPGLLMTGGGRGDRQAQIYWQRGERFYVLSVAGPLAGDTLAATLIQAAESVR
ncbi:MAG: hypothetical protein OHK0050_25000 [Roseiflexaceae bacterium]